MRVLTMILILCLGAVTSLKAEKFIDITKEMLQEKESPIENEAEAAYLLKNVSIKYDFGTRTYLNLEYHFVVKVYEEGGESYAEFEIPIYEKSSMNERVEKVKAKTYNLKGDQIVITELSKKDIYKENTSEFYRTVKFALPDVKSGSIFQVQYMFRTPYIYTIPDWYFQEYIPVASAEYKILVPDYIALTAIPAGTIRISHEERDAGAGMEHKFFGKDIKSCKEDKYVLNENDYRSSLKYELRSVAIPGNGVQHYSKSWKDIAVNLMEEDNFGGQLDKNIPALKEIVSNALKMEESKRVAFLYDFIQDNFNWNERYGYRSRDGLRKFVDKKSGSVGDINLLLINLLRKAGFDAHPMLLKSRYSGLLNKAFPSISELNYVVACLKKGDSYELIDGTSKYNPLGELPMRASTPTGILILEKEGIPVDLKSPNIYKIQTISKYAIDIESNELIGSSQRKRSNYAATKYRIDIQEKDFEDEDDGSDEDIDDESEMEESKDQEDDIQQYNLENSYEVTEVRNFDDIDKPVYIMYEEKIHTCSKIIEDKIFVDAAFDFGLEKNPFDESEREYPVFYNYMINNSYTASLDIPEGYKVESLPEQLVLALPEETGIYQYEAKMIGDKVSVTQIFKMNKESFMPHEYAGLKTFYDMMSKKAKEKIVLTKA